VLEQLSETVSASTDNESIQKPRKENIIMSKFDLELFQTNQGEAPAVIGQQDVDRSYILALQKVKPEHATYYRMLKKDLNEHFASGNSAQNSFKELKRLSSSVTDIATLTRKSTSLDAHEDIKTMKTFQEKLSDEDRESLCRALATAFTIQRRDLLDSFYNGGPLLDNEKSDMKSLKTDSQFENRAKLDSWLIWITLSKLEGSKKYDLAEWGIIDKLCDYILYELVKPLEAELKQEFNMEPIADDDQVIQDAGELPENSDGEDVGNSGSGAAGGFQLPDSYFRNESVKVPSNLKREDETDSAYKLRVKKWLTSLSDHEFTQVAKLIDGGNESEQEFAMLYTAEQKRRAGIKTGDTKPSPCGCCTIF